MNSTWYKKYSVSNISFANHNLYVVLYFECRSKFGKIDVQSICSKYEKHPIFLDLYQTESSRKPLQGSFPQQHVSTVNNEDKFGVFITSRYFEKPSVAGSDEAATLRQRAPAFCGA